MEGLAQVNLIVTNLERAKEFWALLGWQATTSGRRDLQARPPPGHPLPHVTRGHPIPTLDGLQLSLDSPIGVG
jgi:hypothetical protein